MAKVPFDLMKILNPNSAGKGVVSRSAVTGALLGGITGVSESVLSSALNKGFRLSSIKKTLADPADMARMRESGIGGGIIGGISGIFAGKKDKQNIIEAYKAKRALLAGSLLGGTGLALHLNKKTIDNKANSF